MIKQVKDIEKLNLCSALKMMKKMQVLLSSTHVALFLWLQKGIYQVYTLTTNARPVTNWQDRICVKCMTRDVARAFKGGGGELCGN